MDEFCSGRDTVEIDVVAGVMEFGADSVLDTLDMPATGAEGSDFGGEDGNEIGGSGWDTIRTGSPDLGAGGDMSCFRIWPGDAGLSTEHSLLARWEEREGASEGRGWEPPGTRWWDTGEWEADWWCPSREDSRPPRPNVFRASTSRKETRGHFGIY